MAWADTLLDASFRGVTFDCLRTRDNATRDTASHEYAYMDGADVEDLGSKARTVAISAVFFGSDYETRLQTFLKELDKPGHGELIHPVFGSIKQAQLTEYEIVHEADSPDYCTVELTFAEATPGNPFFVQQLPAQKAEAVTQLAETGRRGGIEAFATALDSLKSVAGNLSRLNALHDVMTGTLGGIRSQVQGIIGTTLDVIDYPRAFASDVTSLIGGMADLRGFDADVIQSDWKSLAGQLDNVVKLPGKVSSGSVSPTSSDSGPAVTDSKPIPANSADVALVTTVVQVAAATTLAETASQILADEAEQPTLSPKDIEQMTNDVRDALQQAIDNHRDHFPLEASRPVTEALKDTALAVQDAAAAVIEAQPPLVTRTVEASGNLHLVAFRWYGDYTRAQQLARLNPQLTNPNALQAGDILYAYAR